MTSIGQIYRHIESMRSCDKPSTYDEIYLFLTEQGYDEAEIKHAIFYTKEKERQTNFILKGKGGSVEYINGIMGGIVILLVGFLALGLMVYFSIKMVEVWSISPEREGIISLNKGSGFIGKLRVRLIIGVIVTFAFTLFLIPLGIRKIKDQNEIRKTYKTKKNRGLLND